MQDYGRAKLFGTPTAGMGGIKQFRRPLYFSGIEVRLSKAVLEKSDGTPIENRGVKPDIFYEITEKDFLNDYQDYHKAYTKALLDMIFSHDLKAVL